MTNNLPLRCGLNWIVNSFLSFREAPFNFIVLGTLLFVTALIPIAGAFLTTILIARFAYITSLLSKKQHVSFFETFAGMFSNHQVLRLGMLNATLSFLIILFDHYFGDSRISTFVVSITAVILQMANWLSPVICLFRNANPVQAMYASLVAVTVYIGPLLIFTCLVIALTMVAILPVGVGLVIWIPILSITSYYAYNDVYASK